MSVHDTEAQRAVLAPVPCLHLHTAQYCKGDVAFGTDNDAFFKGPHAPSQGTLCLIYASSRQHGCGHLYVPKKATFVAIFDRFRPADKNGAYSDDSARPVTTVTDTPFKAFWVVRGLIHLPEQAWVEIVELKSERGKAIVQGYPIGPIRVVVAPKLVQSISAVLKF